MPLIRAVDKGGPCGRLLKPGDKLLCINGQEINDLLDYMFYTAETRLEIVFERGGKRLSCLVTKGEYEEPGLEFEDYLMDEKRSCKNKCVFCFIDQLPPGMRETLYFKDDDARLSFLMGNYITLTNLSEKDIERIIKLKISPINISVHALNPEIRTLMMKNPRAAECEAIMRRFAEAGIGMNTQIVLCPGINDGEVLKETLSGLGAFYPFVESIAVVPVGLTKYREGLYPLSPVTEEDAAKTIRIIDEFAEKFSKEHGTRLAYAADELFLKAGEQIPPDEYYEEYAQLENGVGMLRLMELEFERELKRMKPKKTSSRVSIATGTAAYPFIKRFIGRLADKADGLTCEVYAIENLFFGKNITVAGLITGRDLIEQLKGRQLHGRLLIPGAMLRYERDRFLDDITLSQAKEALGCEIEAVESGGAEFIGAVLGEENDI